MHSHTRPSDLEQLAWSGNAAANAIPVTPVAARLGELQAGLRAMDGAVERLAGQLSPALRIDPPSVANQNKDGGGSPMCSPLATTLSEVLNHLQVIHARVDSIAGRVEL